MELRRRCASDERQLGDLAKNAVLWLIKAADRSRSSLSLPTPPPPIDSARLRETPYLAALGYLYGAGLLVEPVPESLIDALDATLRRSPHTAERGGFADDPVRAVGLLLLAAASENGAAAQQIRHLLTEFESVSPVASLLIAAAGGVPLRPTLLDAARPADMAVAVLAAMAADADAARVFPGFALEAASERLVEHACVGRVSLTADIDSMTTLAALESLFSADALHQRTDVAEAVVDVAIVIALKEEFRVLFEHIKDRHEPVEDGDRHYYFFNSAGSPPYRCVATFVGDMGNLKAGLVTEKAIERWRPAVVAMLGIAAGIHDDVRVGDVVVATQVDDYLEGAKAVGQREFLRGGSGYQADHALLDRVRNVEFAHPGVVARWKGDARARLDAAGIDVDALVRRGLVRAEPEQHEAHVASGPVVAASEEFVAWVRGGDRSYKALEMESGGLVTSAHMSPHGTTALVLRSISDYGDDRKKDLDSVGRGALRRYAMQNAIEFLWALMVVGTLPRAACGGL